MRCSFCGHESAARATSCISCGNVFAAPPPSRSPVAAVEAPAAYDAAVPARAAVQARWMLWSAAVLSVAAAGGVAAGWSRFGVVLLADESLTLGALVMAGGWAQQVAAQGRLLGGSVSPAVALWAWPGAVAALWRESAPSAEPSTGVPTPVRAIQALVAVALVLRVTSLAATGPAWVVASRAAWVAAALATARLVSSLTARQAQRGELRRALEG